MEETRSALLLESENEEAIWNNEYFGSSHRDVLQNSFNQSFNRALKDLTKRD